MPNLFSSRVETAVFRLPGNNRETACAVEFRRDPLTGRTSVICESLLEKLGILYGETDRVVLRQMAEESRKNCIFCAPTVFESTPSYPETICVDGRLRGHNSILFPNLFPIAEIHSVLTWPDHHFLTPSEFTADLMSELFTLVQQFACILRQKLPSQEFLTLNCNYMPPAGASVIHPHFQFLGTREPPYRLGKIMDAASKWVVDRHENYWDVLCDAEEQCGDRWIGTRGTWRWIMAWSPLGANEVMGIHESAHTLFDLDAADWRALAEGLHLVLCDFDERSFSSFNFCLSGGSLTASNGQRCVIRVISRQNVKSMYRNDEYFLQKFHGIELIVMAPETMASALRFRFA